MLLNACAEVIGSHLAGQGEGGVCRVQDNAKGAAPTNMASSGARGQERPLVPETAASKCAMTLGR
jgi:hypothetical protein